MEQLVIVSVSVEKWIIKCYVHGLLDGSCEVVRFPTQNGKMFHTGKVTCNVGMVIEGRCAP